MHNSSEFGTASAEFSVNSYEAVAQFLHRCAEVPKKRKFLRKISNVCFPFSFQAVGLPASITIAPVNANKTLVWRMMTSSRRKKWPSLSLFFLFSSLFQWRVDLGSGDVRRAVSSRYLTTDDNSNANRKVGGSVRIRRGVSLSVLMERNLTSPQRSKLFSEFVFESPIYQTLMPWGYLLQLALLLWFPIFFFPFRYRFCFLCGSVTVLAVSGRLRRAEPRGGSS